MERGAAAGTKQRMPWLDSDPFVASRLRMTAVGRFAIQDDEREI